MDTPVVSVGVLIFLSVESRLIVSISSAVAGSPLANSTPAYRSSVFSRKTTRSMSSYLLRTPT